ncbi:MAG: hypothetical protein JWM21_1554 [Acidobacteria bacterium]|nr:hypothetical protein [Acidobacteriota bacterium]
MRKPGLVLFAGLFGLAALFCPPVRFAQQDKKSEDFWLLQARVFTDYLLSDAARLDRFDRPVMLGQLAAIWWKDDQEHAQVWVQKAIHDLENGASYESQPDRRRRLAAARALLKITARMDKVSSDHLASLFMSETNPNSGADDRENANSLAGAALEVLERDPQQALELGLASLRAGRCSQFTALLWNLRARDIALGDVLFIAALKVAQAAADQDLLTSLAAVAFNGPAPLDELRRNVLSVMAPFLLAAPGATGDGASGCRLAAITEPLLGQFDRLLPEKAPFVRNSVARCLRPSRDSTEPAPASPPKTVEELLQAADKAADVSERASYRGRAAYLASQQEDFDRALQILDGFSEEERRELDGTWENWRWDFASSAAIAHLKKADRYGADKIITSTPAALRAFVQISVANAMADNGDQGTAIRYLNEGRQGLQKVDADDAVDWYLSLLRRYESLAPNEGPAVFHELIEVMNHRDEPKPSGETKNSGSYSSMAPMKLPAFLLQRDVNGVRETVSLIESSAARASARLGLLNSSLELWRKETAANKPGKNKARAH